MHLVRFLGRTSILAHTEALPEEAANPLLHYERSGADLLNLLEYVELGIDSRPHYPAVKRRHLSRLNGMILVNLIETLRVPVPLSEWLPFRYRG